MKMPEIITSARSTLVNAYTIKAEDSAPIMVGKVALKALTYLAGIAAFMVLVLVATPLAKAALPIIVAAGIVGAICWFVLSDFHIRDGRICYGDEKGV